MPGGGCGGSESLGEVLLQAARIPGTEEGLKRLSESAAKTGDKELALVAGLASVIAGFKPKLERK